MDLVGWGEEGDGGMYGDSNMETYVTICKTANGNLLYDSGNSNLGSVTIYREVEWGGNICIPKAGSCWCLEETNTVL